MDRRLLVFAVCAISFLPLIIASCPSGERYCSDRGGCISTSQNCSKGDIVSCINMTASCYENGTLHCVDVMNYTCSNISCDNDTQYCPTKKKCINKDEYCCTELEESCVDIVKYKHFFAHSEELDTICNLLASNGNFTQYYTNIKYRNLLEDDKMCDNGTYFCPMAGQCIPMNHSCNPDRVFRKNPHGIFQQDCNANKTFCLAYTHCIPSSQNCSYRALFDWHDAGNKLVDPFSQQCSLNLTFCPRGFSCNDSCNSYGQCGVNDTECKGKLSAANFTNVTDPTGSGWLETCKYRELIKDVLWKKASECKPHAEKCKKKKCDFEICEKLLYINRTEWIWEQMKMKDNVTVLIESCNVTVTLHTMQKCNFTMKHKNMSCDSEKLCHILKGKKEYGNMSMNGSMWIEECNITINASLKMLECNMTKNFSCDPKKLCHILKDQKEYGNMSMNGSMWIEECNITMNVSEKMLECNMTKKFSCDPKKLCHILKDKKKHGEMPANGSMWVEECNITINASLKMIECNLTKNISCDPKRLCYILKDKKKDGNMPMNGTMWVEECNITVNASAKMLECNLTKNHKPCNIKELCDDLESFIEQYENGSMVNATVTVNDCNVTLNKHFYQVCSKNRSCEVHKLCRFLGDALQRYSNDSTRNESVTVWNCTVNVDRTVYDICTNHSCELRELCKPLSKKLDMYKNGSWWFMMNSTVEVKMCNLTLNQTVLEHCNITMKKNDSKNCKIDKLCKRLIANNYNSSMLNMTIHVDDCEIKFDKKVVDTCNITFDSLCKDLCSRYRELGRNHTKYSFPKYIGKCRVNMDDFEQCNVTLQEIGDYYYEMFYNGFKISTSVKKNVSYIAIRDAGMASRYGGWEYKNSGTWTPLGQVSSKHAMVLASETRLRFVANDSSWEKWHGLAILKYTPVKSRPIVGNHVDVSDTLHDPRNTLALLQYPTPPAVNVLGVVKSYTVGEDVEEPGMSIARLMEARLLHRTMDIPMDGNMSKYFEYLDPKMVKDYNDTVECFKKFEVAIAITTVGKPSEGTWQVNKRPVSASISKPRLVTSRDLLRFVSSKNVHGNWLMKFVAVTYSNCSDPVKAEYSAPPPFAHALNGVMMIQNTSKQVRKLVEVAVRVMEATDRYSLENFNSAVDTLDASLQDKNKVKDIASEAFDAVTLPQENPRSGLPRFFNVKDDFVFLNNPTQYTLNVIVTPINDQPVIEIPRIFLPAIAYNLTTHPNVGRLVGDLLTQARASDVDGVAVQGIAIVQALNSSFGSWYYQSPSGVWTQIIINNVGYSDGFSGDVSAVILNSSFLIKFQMHNDDIFWNNVEASQHAKIVFLPWDGSDNASVGLRTVVSRPSEDSAPYGKRSVTAIVQRFGCDGREGSKGRHDRCGVCGGNGRSCVGCDNVLYSRAKIDECGNCTGGTTNVSYNAMKDCGKGCGSSFLDQCGACQLKGSIVNFTDCTGTCYGNATTNKCGFCSGGSSGKLRTYGEDACGICGGDNSTCLDCENVPNGGKVRDFCNNCLLRTDRRFNSECVKLKRSVPNSGPSHGGMKMIVQGAGLKNYSTVVCQILNNATNVRTEISSSSFGNNNGRVIQFMSPALTPGYHTILCRFDNLGTFYAVEETFLVYNKSAITYTSITPDSTDINMTRTAVIVGSGFVNASDIACVLRDGRMFEAVFESSTRVSCTIPATRNSVKLALGVSFSRGDRNLGEKYLNFTIYANASNPVSARFLNNLRGIVIHFDVPTKPKMRTVSCSNFFPSSNVSLFGGSKSQCVFVTPVKMIIKLRRRATIVPGDNLTFMLRSITQQYQKVTKEPSEMYKDLVVASPSKPVVPTAKLSGTPLLGICAKLRLNGGRSSGGGGRPLTFIWNATWDDPSDASINANATADLLKIRQYLESLSQFKVRANNDVIVVGLRYKFTLKVRDFLGQESSEASLVVLREDKSLPGLDLGPKKRKIKAAFGIILQSKIKLSSCLPVGYKPKVLYTWEIQAVGINLGVKDKPRLLIPPRLLTGGVTYTLTLTATMESDVTLTTTATIQLEVISSSLKAIIKGGESRVVGEDDTLLLDGSYSSDPDRTSETAVYEWRCFDGRNNPCFIADVQNLGRPKRLVIPFGRKRTINVAQTLKTNSNYTFVLVFKKGSRHNEARVNVIVMSGTPPLVLIRPSLKVKVNPTDILKIESIITSKKIVTATWSCVQSEEYGFIDLESEGVALTPLVRTFSRLHVSSLGKAKIIASPSLVIAKNKLEDGVTYKFKLTAKHSDSSSFADIEITTNAAPSLGLLEIQPASGFFGNTTFTFSAAEGWTDDEEDLPLMYQFGYYGIEDSGERREEFLGTPIEANFLENFILPQGLAANNYTLTVFVKVFDIHGAIATQEATVIVKPRQLDAGAVNKLADAVDTDFEAGDLSKATATANAVADSLLNSNPNDPNVRNAVKEFKKTVTDKVLSLIEGGGARDKSGKNVVRDSLSRMTVGCKPGCNPARILRNLLTLYGIPSAQPQKRRRRAVVVDYDSIEVRTAADVEVILEISQNVLDPNNYTNSSLEAKASFLSTVQAQEPSLCKPLAVGGPYELAKTNITVMRVVKDTFLNVDTKFMEISTSTAPEYIEASITYRLGQTLKTQYESWICSSDDETCTGTCIATAQFKDDFLIQHDPAEKNITRLSDVASIRLYNPENLAQLSVSGLANPVILRFPINNGEMYENYTKECRIWHEGSKEWQMSGCSVSTSNNSIVECSCTQLGYIAAFLGEKQLPTTALPTTPEPTHAGTTVAQEATRVEFAFQGNYSDVISGNITKSSFTLHLQQFLAKLLNISQARITDIDIRSGSIIVTFTIQPSNDINKASVNSTISLLDQLVKANNVNFTLPGSNKILRVDPSSFRIIGVSPTTSATTLRSDDDDDGLSTAEIVIIIVVCVIVVIAIIAGLAYYFLRVKPARAGKISPHSSDMQLNEQQNNNQVPKTGMDNNAVVTDEKSV